VDADGDTSIVKINRVIRKRIAHDEDGISLAGGITAAISASVNEPGESTTHVSATDRIVQRTGSDTDAQAGGAPKPTETDEGGRNG
jgi:hypothetical protein